MIVTKKALPRRTILKGIGAAVALPFLDAMVPAFAATANSAANPASRFTFLYFPHGAHRPEWIPKSDAPGFELPRTLQPLEPMREHINVITNIDLCQAPLPVGHFYSNVMFLNGTRPDETKVHSGKTIDQIIADKYGQDTPLPSLEVCTEDISSSNGQCEVGSPCVYGNTISWRDATTPLPMELDPKVVFKRLFGAGGGSAQERTAREVANRSILDNITKSVSQLRGSLGPTDQARLTDYLDSVREIERRIEKAATSSGGLDLPAEPGGIPDSYDDHARLLLDLIVLAYQGNVTRVSSFMLARELSPRTYNFIGVPDGHHSVSHNGEAPAVVEKYVKINTYHVQLFSDFLKKLNSIQDGDGTLLDHSMVLYGSGMGNSNGHSHDRIPLILAGGASGSLKGGRHIVAKPQTQMANLLLGILDKAKVPASSIGDSTEVFQL
jgi:hypothetical protein